ncbi:MAG: glycosyltransferase family 39 protein [Deltaproteobacteria bacterium]|nr:glycosyltransferase family 39 protein [Deltaproteobacteria bacterium]
MARPIGVMKLAEEREAQASPRVPPTADPHVALVLVTVVLLGLHGYAAAKVGFGDSEALYASWAMHPQPAYLDHPGLVGTFARAIGEGSAPTPLRAHVVTTILAALVPWLAYATARAAGAERRPSAIAALAIAVVPEIAVGLFAMTPDLLLAPAWLGTLALAATALRAPAGTTKAATSYLGAGLLAGIACSAKVSGVLLVVALIATYLSAARARSGGAGGSSVRTVWPIAGLLAGAIVVVPILAYEAKTGWPMLRHRFVDTQTGSGIALTNLGALFLGQLAYVSPVLAWAAVLAARALLRDRGRDAVAKLFFFAFVIPFVPLVLLCVWSPVAEPHWIAPALLVLPVAAARIPAVISRRVFVGGASLAGVLTLATHAYVLLPASSALLPASADPKVDIASELYGWPIALDAVREQMRTAGTPFDPEGREVVVVGPHWTVCAQLQAALPGIRVGCATPIPDDFDRWLPRDEWRRADNVLFVTDNRYPGDGAEQLPSHVRSSQARVRIMRGGRTSRIFELFLYSRRGAG